MDGSQRRESLTTGDRLWMDVVIHDNQLMVSVERQEDDGVGAGLEYNDPEFEVGADLVLDWVTGHRDELVAETFTTDEAYSFNVPTCDPADMGEMVEVPLATEFPEDHGNPFQSDCDLADPDPSDDVAAVRAGYPSLTSIPADL